MALVVTIVILIILATISINAVLGENGLIKKAQETKDFHEQAKGEEENQLDSAGEKVGDYLNGYNGDGTPPEYEDETLAVIPKVAKGMQKVKYNSSTNKWEKVTQDDEKWYDYSETSKEWANVVLPAEGTLEDLFNADGTLNEDKKYVQLVWIPRFAYQITSQYHTGGTGAGNIEVVFIDTANQNKSKTKTYVTTYPNATAGASSGMSDYVVHPAFDFGGEHLAGFWMGKFESSHTGCTQDKSTGSATYTGNEVMMVKPNVTSWRSISISNIYNTCLNMNKENNIYGLTVDNVTDKNGYKVDPHMCKNDEWGAVAYLSKSKYGKQTEEVYINNSSDSITGNAGSTASASFAAGVTNAYKTPNGVKASTTGNATGIYDMSGGAWENVAAYVNNGHSYLTDTKYGKAVYEGDAKYKNVYYSTTTSGTDTQATDYEYANPNYTGTYPSGYTKKYGDAVWETSQNGMNASPYSWYSEYSCFPNTWTPFFYRSVDCRSPKSAGQFAYHHNSGEANTDSGFRVIVPVL